MRLVELLAFSRNHRNDTLPSALVYFWFLCFRLLVLGCSSVSFEVAGTMCSTELHSPKGRANLTVIDRHSCTVIELRSFVRCSDSPATASLGSRNSRRTRDKERDHSTDTSHVLFTACVLLCWLPCTRCLQSCLLRTWARSLQLR